MNGIKKLGENDGATRLALPAGCRCKYGNMPPMLHCDFLQHRKAALLYTFSAVSRGALYVELNLPIDICTSFVLFYL